MLTNMNGRYAEVGEAVIFSDGRFNHPQDREGKTLSVKYGTGGMAFVAVRQKDKDTCETFFDSHGIERTLASRPGIMAGSSALDAVLEKVKYGEWKDFGIRCIKLVTRSEYLFNALVNGQVYKWQFFDWMVKTDKVIMQRPNSDLWEDIIDILNDFNDIKIEVKTMFLKKENYSVLNTLPENPISLALQASDGTNFVKDEWFEKTFGDLTQKS